MVRSQNQYSYNDIVSDLTNIRLSGIYGQFANIFFYKSFRCTTVIYHFGVKISRKMNRVSENSRCSLEIVNCPLGFQTPCENTVSLHVDMLECCCCCLPCYHRSKGTYVVEEILTNCYRLRSTHCWEIL